VIVRLTGGLANQLFMYAFGRSLSEKRHEPVKFFWARSTWDYALDKFNCQVDLVNAPLYNPIYDEKTFGFDKDVYATPPDTYFRGYWQTEKYFVNPQRLREEITLRLIRPEVAYVADLLRNQNSVFVHVRRGDYLNPGTAAYHGNLGHASLQEGYYKDAVNYILEKVNDPKFVVFSDDPEWCRQNLPYPVINFEHHEDLYLMSQCKHGIGANSTFSWWANWLGEYPGRVCIAPNKWFNAEADTRDIIPERWVKIV
jgi:hypothetical protein